MLSSRIVVYGQDEAAVRPWVGAVAATGGTVDLVNDVSAIDPRSDLLVAEVPATSPEALFQKLGELEASCSTILIQPTPNLLLAANQLRNPAIHAVLVKDHVSQALLTCVAARLLRGNIFGISKMVSWGVRVYSEIVGSHDDRLQALATLSRFTSSLKLRAKYREAIDLVADELLMNGLYDAPIDAKGKAVFGEVAPSQRSGMRLERPAVLQFASDGTRLIVAVRDSFGSLRRDSVLTNLERCAAEGDQIDRKTAGAGLGLYLVANHVSEMSFHVLSGVATEVACVVNLKSPRQQLMHLGFYEESVQGAEKGEGGESQLVSVQQQSSRAVHLTLVVAVLLLIVAGLLMAWPYIIKPPKGDLKVTSNPPGALIRINGIRKGVADPMLEIKDVSANAPTAIAATLEGFEEAQEVVKLKKNQTLEVKLDLSRMRAKLRVSSSPQGSQVFIDGKDTGQKTPTILEDLDPDKEFEIEMRMHGFTASSGSVKPVASQTLIYHAKLTLAPGFAMVGLKSTPPGARLLINDVDTGEVTPIPGFVVRGGQKYSLKLIAEGRVPWTYEWVAKQGDRLVKEMDLPEGGQVSITSNVSGRVIIGNVEASLPLKAQVVPAGVHIVRIRNRAPLVDHAFRVTVDAGQHITRQLNFGFVKVEGKKWKIKLQGHRPAPKVAFRPGTQQITIVDRKGDTRTTEVMVNAKKTITIDGNKLGPEGATTPPKKAPKKALKKASKKSKKAAAKAAAAKAAAAKSAPSKVPAKVAP